MKITIIGAGGNIGRRIVKEAATRNHELKLITSKPKTFFELEKAEIQEGDIFDEKTLTRQIEGSDLVISAYAPPHEDTKLLIAASQHLVAAAKKANTRLIAVGGAGSLKVSETTQLVDTPNFPEEYKAIALVHREALENIYQKENDLNWTNVSPSAYIFEGERTNSFRIGENELLVNDKGESAISMEDFAIGILDEAENTKFNRKRFTIGY